MYPYHNRKYSCNTRHPHESIFLLLCIGSSIASPLTTTNVILKLRESAIVCILVDVRARKEGLDLPARDFSSSQRKKWYNSIWIFHIILWAKHASVRGIIDAEFKPCDCIATCFTRTSKLDADDDREQVGLNELRGCYRFGVECPTKCKTCLT
jgi:hypothetical protein